MFPIAHAPIQKAFLYSSLIRIHLQVKSSLFAKPRSQEKAEKKYCEHRIVEFYRGSGLVMTADKPHALVFGHSFVRRIGEFIDRNNPEEGYSRDFCLSNICDTSI